MSLLFGRYEQAEDHPSKFSRQKNRVFVSEEGKRDETVPGSLINLLMADQSSGQPKSSEGTGSEEQSRVEATQGQLARGLEEVNKLQGGDPEEEELVKSVEFVHEADLLYAVPTFSETTPVCCARGCEKTGGAGGSSGDSGGKCSKCGGAIYCSRACQVQDWKASHKRLCGRAKPLVSTGAFNKRAAAVRLLRKIRLYSAPFAVAREAEIGEPGAVLMQTRSTLEEFALLEARCDPRRGFVRYERSVVLDYLTAADFKETIAKDDFELVPVAAALEEAIESLDSATHYLTLCKFRCGKICIIKQEWVPPKAVCTALASDYTGKASIQLNLEDEE